MQVNWAQDLNPVIANQLVNGQLLQSVKLAAGKNVVNHKLGRTLIGWFPTRIRSSATFYDQQDGNSNPATTLILYASAACTADLWVF
jgi:hypothetical protein